MKSNKVTRRRNKKQKRKEGSRKGIVSRDTRVPGLNIQVRTLGVPDTQVGTFLYAELPNLQFNAALQVADIYYAMNTMATVRAGNAAIPFWEEVARSYARYTVLHSSITVKVQNRETVNSLVICVWPTLTNSTISTATQYATVASLPGAKQFLLQASSGGMSTHTFRLKMNLTRMVGAQYLQQDQWAGLATLGTGGCQNADPTSFVYWGLAFYNPTGNNTLTTGGVTIQTEIRSKVLLAEPLRTIASDLVRDPRNPNCKLIRSKSVEEIQRTVESIRRVLDSRDLPEGSTV